MEGEEEEEEEQEEEETETHGRTSEIEQVFALSL